MEKILISDVDGVLCFWEVEFEKFITKKGYPKIKGTDNEYSMSIRHGISAINAQNFIKEFNEGDYIANLKPFADSVEYVTKLAKLGFRFIVVTSLSDLSSAKAYRTQNLINLFGDVFDEIVCLEMGASKANVLMRWADTKYFWIEDHMRQAEAGYEAGLRPILINHPYNSHYTTDLFLKVSHITPWKEIYNIVCKDYEISISGK